MRMSRRMVIGCGSMNLTQINSISVASGTYRYTSLNTVNTWQPASYYDKDSPIENFIGYKTDDVTNLPDRNTTLIPTGSFSFAGRSIKMVLTVTGYCPSTNFETRGFRWAICSSDANKTKYQGYSEVTDDNYQLASGLATFEYNNQNYRTYTIECRATNLPANKPLYVYFWPNGQYTDVAHIQGTVLVQIQYEG